MFTSISSYIWGGAASDTNSSSSSGVGGDGAGAEPGDQAAAVRPPRDPSPFEGGDEWVLVGSGAPAPGNLARTLEPLCALLPSSLGSSPASSSSASEAADEDDVEESPSSLIMAGAAAAAVSAVSPTATARLPSPPTVRSHQDLVLAVEARAARAGQAASQRASGKALSSKALKRSNKAVMMMTAATGRQQRKQVARTCLSFKMAGANKNLKQC